MSVLKAYEPMDAVITVGEDTTGAFPVTVKLIGSNGKELADKGAVFAYLATDSDGFTIAADGTDTDGFVVDTGGALIPVVANVAGYLVGSGTIEATVTVLTTKTAYLVVVLPNGRVVVSTEMAYTAPQG